MKNLKELGLQELSEPEMQIQNGGVWPFFLREAVKWGGRLLTAAAVVDAYNDFIEGMNSVECEN